MDGVVGFGFVVTVIVADDGKYFLETVPIWTPWILDAVGMAQPAFGE